MSKRHHAVPQFLLRRFANGNGLLWLHDLHLRSAVRVQPKDALVESRLYAPGVGDNPNDDAVESFLAQHIEGPAAIPVEKLAGGESLAFDERYAVSLLIAFQEIRTPRMRDAVGNLVERLADGVLRMSAEHPDYIRKILTKVGHEVSDSSLASLVESIRSGRLRAQATKIPWLQSSTIAFEIADLVCKMPWSVVEAPKGFEFVISDSPVTKVLTDPSIQGMMGVGWISPSAESTFALDPAHCLAILRDGKEQRLKGDKEWCKDVNIRMVRQAKRFVVSRSRSSYVETVATKYRKAEKESGRLHTSSHRPDRS